MTHPLRVLLAEDNPAWQDILKMHIAHALRQSDPTEAAVHVHLADTYQKADAALRDSDRWNLLVVDLGLPPDDEYVYGLDLVAGAKKRNVPCIVVTGLKTLNTEVVSWLLKYDARGFFIKEKLSKSPEARTEFQELVRLAQAKYGALSLGPGEPAGPVIPPSPVSEHVFRQLKSGRWEIQFPGDTMDDSFEDLKGFGDLHTLIRRSPRLVPAVELIPESEDPVHAVQTRMRNALSVLKKVMPLLAEHLELCKQQQSNSFRYDPGATPPRWVLD